METKNMSRIALELSLEEYNFIRAVLGDLPTKSNAWVLLNSLERQAQAHAATNPESDVKVGGSD